GLQGLNVRDLSSAPVVRAILETKCWGIKLQICRRMLNWERAGAILSLFIPAVWQEHAKSSSPFPQFLWDDCVCFSSLPCGRFKTSSQHFFHFLWDGCEIFSKFRLLFPCLRECALSRAFISARGARLAIISTKNSTNFFLSPGEVVTLQVVRRL